MKRLKMTCGAKAALRADKGNDSAVEICAWHTVRKSIRLARVSRGGE